MHLSWLILLYGVGLFLECRACSSRVYGLKLSG